MTVSLVLQRSFDKSYLRIHIILIIRYRKIFSLTITSFYCLTLLVPSTFMEISIFLYLFHSSLTLGICNYCT